MRHSDSLPPFSSGFVSFTLRYRWAPACSLPCRSRHHPTRARVFTDSLKPPLPIGDDRVSQVPKGPLYLHAPLSTDPGRTLTRCRYMPRCCLPPTQQRRLLRPRNFRGSMTRPAGSLCTLGSEGYPLPPNTRFWPPARLAIRIFPFGSLRKVSKMCLLHLFLLS